MDKASKEPPCSCSWGVGINTRDAGQVGHESWVCPSESKWAVLPVSLLALPKSPTSIEPSVPHGGIMAAGCDGMGGCEVWPSSWHVVDCCPCSTSLRAGHESWVHSSEWIALPLLASSKFSMGTEGSGPHGEITFGGVAGCCGVCWQLGWHAVGCRSCPTMSAGKAGVSLWWDRVDWHFCTCPSLDTPPS